MKVLHFFPFYEPEKTGGAERHVHFLTRELVRRGVQVELLATASRSVLSDSYMGLNWPQHYPAGTAASEGLTIERRPARNLPLILKKPMAFCLRRRLEAENLTFGRSGECYQAGALARPRIYDRLSSWLRGPRLPGLVRHLTDKLESFDLLLAGFVPFNTMFDALAAGRAAGKPVLLLPLFHAGDPLHHFRHFYRAFRQAAGVLASSEYNHRIFSGLGARSHRVGLGIDPEEFAAAGISGQRFRQRFGLADKKIVLLVGRKTSSKGYQQAIEAVERLSETSVRLVMIGADEDRLPITSSRVLYLGEVSRDLLLDAYAACDVFVLPSLAESFGLVYLEAWASGKPVIGQAACGPVASLIREGQDGFLCRDAGGLKEKIELVLGQPQLAERLGAAGRARVLAEFTWERVGARVEQVYRQIVQATAATSHSGRTGR